MNNHKLLRSLMLVALSACSTSVGVAQDAPLGDARAGVVKMTGRITGVEGIVQLRDAEDQPWRRAAVDMTVNENTEFRTGPKSAVRFVIPPDQTITLDRLGTVKLLQAVNNNGKVVTNLGMEYGRTRYDIEAAGVEHQSTISSPNSTLAVRGTKVSLYDQPPFRPEAVSLTGRASFRDGKKQLAFGGKNKGKATVNADEPNAASSALALAVVDPSSAAARSASEEALVDTLLSRGATVTFDDIAGIKVVRGGTVPTDQELVPVLPGVLNVVVRWERNSDINLAVSSPGGANGAGELLYPIAGLAANQSGGKIDFDHRGGANGGIEVAYWPAGYPLGLYGVGLILASGQPTLAQVEVFENGRRIGIFDGESIKQSVSVPVLPPTPGIGEGTAVGIVGVGTTIPGVRSGATAAFSTSAATMVGPKKK